MTREEAIAFRKLVELGSASLDDKTLSTAPQVCRRMQYDGSLIPNGTRIYWPEDGRIYKNGSDLWDREEFNPTNSPDLWVEILYRLGIRIIPPKIEVSTKFSKGELGWWGDTLCRSKVDNNVYTPEEYPDNWEIVKKG